MEAQLVGQICVFCRKSVDSIVEGQFCSACGAPHHHDCRRTDRIATAFCKCPVCGCTALPANDRVEDRFAKPPAPPDPVAKPPAPPDPVKARRLGAAFLLKIAGAGLLGSAILSGIGGAGTWSVGIEVLFGLLCFVEGVRREQEARFKKRNPPPTERKGDNG
jgi:hypothetical protein